MDTPDAVSGQPSIKIVRRPRVQTARGLWRLRSRRNALPPLSPGKAFPPLADSRTNELSRPAATSTKLPAMSASAAPNHANPAPVPGRDPGVATCRRFPGPRVRPRAGPRTGSARDPLRRGTKGEHPASARRRAGYRPEPGRGPALGRTRGPVRAELCDGYTAHTTSRRQSPVCIKNGANVSLFIEMRPQRESRASGGPSAPQSGAAAVTPQPSCGNDRDCLSSRPIVSASAK